MNHAKKDPLALEDVVKSKLEEKNANAKPKFLSKEERAALALARRAAEVEKLRDQQAEEREQRKTFFEEARHAPPAPASTSTSSSRFGRGAAASSNDRGGRDRRDDRGDWRRRDRSRSRSRDRGDRRRRDPSPHSRRGGNDRDRDRDRPRGGNGRDRDRGHDDRERDRDGPTDEELKNLTPEELELIRERYMGGDKRKRRTRRTNDRRFVFDWDASEDTSRDANPLYDRRVEYNAFGRGHLGGMGVASSKDADNEKLDNRRWTEKSLHEMKERDWRIFKEDFNITTKGGNVPHPLRSWRESSIPRAILEVIDAVGYKEPTPIQRQSIPIGLQNRDMMGIAETGSGKTLTFLVPMLSFIMSLPKIVQENANLGPYALIMVPTRELAQQIEVEATKFARPLGYRCVSIVGGHSIEEQSFSLSQGCEIIIATPGRLKECLERRIVVLGQCCYVVMDEADRMIDMGFEADVTFILDNLPISAEELKEREAAQRSAAHAASVSSAAANRYSREEHDQDALARARSAFQNMGNGDGMGHHHHHYGMDQGHHNGGDASGDAATSSSGVVIERHPLPASVLAALGGKHFRQMVMYSATMPPQVERLAQKYLRKPATVIIGNAGKAVDTVDQRVEFLGDENRRKARMLELLEEYAPPIIVFFNQKRSVDNYHKQLARDGWRVTALHGGKSQDAREASIAALKRGEADILLATNVAGRGLDVPDVSLVVNFDMSKNIEEYTHRIGRTGRAGKKGTAVTFLGADDAEVLYDLKNLLVKSPVSRCPPELANHPDAQVRPGQFVAKRKYEETLYAK
ncbi:mRNA splicing protein prp28 [Blastocladiella emersonii ATCC 22665]|nr:mRNA splicing protein prp28 [Blastocladiella emersonii ATCC 22665]